MAFTRRLDPPSYIVETQDAPRDLLTRYGAFATLGEYSCWGDSHAYKADAEDDAAAQLLDMIDHAPATEAQQAADQQLRSVIRSREVEYDSLRTLIDKQCVAQRAGRGQEPA